MAEKNQLRLKSPEDSEESRIRAEFADSMQVAAGSRVKFVIFGEEIIEKRVTASGNSGRIYLPPEWIGHRVKITRID